MAWARNELDPRSLQVVVGISQCLNLQLTSVAGTGIDVADTKRASQNAEYILLQGFSGQLFHRRSSLASLGEGLGQ